MDTPQKQENIKYYLAKCIHGKHLFKGKVYTQKIDLYSPKEDNFVRKVSKGDLKDLLV